MLSLSGQAARLTPAAARHYPAVGHLLAASRPAASHLLAAGGGPSPLWYATRATGVVALVLLTITVALGVAGTARFTSPRWPRVITAGLHRNIALLVVAFVAVHVLTTVLDSFTSISIVSAVIPFSSSYRTLWLGLGTIAFDLLLALAVTSLLRDRLPYRAWRGVHWLAYASWPIALWHGLGTGTDSKLSWLLALDAACVLVVAAATWWRLLLARPGPGRAAAMAATIAVPLATVIFAVAGPLQAGWARRAGTPVALLGESAGAAPGTRSAASVFTGRVTVAHARPGGGEIMTVTAQTTGQPGTDLTIVLRGRPDGTGIDLSSGTVRIGAPGAASYAGPVTLLRGEQLTAALRSPAGQAEKAEMTLVVSGSRASGQLVVQPEGSA
ncbi:MAG: ferric reductase-like transmembrane domain-containing protein [Streptosporangiaceae bacterium]|jgi:hypothetical protein